MPARQVEAKDQKPLVETEGPKEPQKVLIATRGPIAVEAIKVFTDLGMKVVVAYTDAEPNSLATRLAEEKGGELMPLGGKSANETFGNARKIAKLAKFSAGNGKIKLFLGYGFLSEKADAVQVAIDHGVIPLTPSPDVMRKVGNKIAGRESARKVRIGRFRHMPVLEGSDHLLTEYPEVVSETKRIGFPVRLKDPEGGGGHDNLAADNEKELEAIYKRIRSNPNCKGVLAEQEIKNAAHIEVQIIGSKGKVIALGLRDCTVQRRGQKVFEKSWTQHVNKKTQDAIVAAAVKHAEAIGFEGAGTWEFLADKDTGGKDKATDFYYLETNPRIQVEHIVTELSTVIENPVTHQKKRPRIIEIMNTVADQEELPFDQKDVKQNGYAIEARVMAEDPRANFTPTSGKLEECEFEEVEGVEIHAGMQSGDIVPNLYDKTIALVNAHGATPEEAERRLHEALSKMRIKGVVTNLPTLLEFLEKPGLIDSDKINTTFFEKWAREKTVEKIKDLDEFIKDGTLEPIDLERELDLGLLLQDPKFPEYEKVEEPSPTNPEETITVEKIVRELSFSEEWKKAQDKTGQECAAQLFYGEREGRRFVIFHLNYDFRQGTMTPAENMAYVQARILASKKGLPLLRIISTAGMDQDTGMQALTGMSGMVDVADMFPVPLSATVYTGYALGGPPASVAAEGIQMAVNQRPTRLGLTGPRYAAADPTKIPENATPTEIYEKFLPPGAHTPVRAYENRQVHRLVDSLGEASDVWTHMLHVLNAPASITDPTAEYKLKERVGYRDIAQAAHPERPGRFHAWIQDFRGVFWTKQRGGSGEVIFLPKDYTPLSYEERDKIVTHIDRPSSADWMSPYSRVFDDIVPLNNPPFEFEGQNVQFPTIIAGLARLEGQPFLVIGQQTQRRNKDGKDERYYKGQEVADWMYMWKIMEEVGIPGKLPLILLGDSQGANGTIPQEDAGQRLAIQTTLKRVKTYPWLVVSVNIAYKGSGGGEPFVNPADLAWWMEYAGGDVANKKVRFSIKTKKFVSGPSDPFYNDLIKYTVSQSPDSFAEGMVLLHQADEIIKEGPHGAHVQPEIAAQEFRRLLIERAIPMLPSAQDKERPARLNAYSKALRKRRNDRSVTAMAAVTVRK